MDSENKSNNNAGNKGAELTAVAQREHRILQFWRDNKIFEATLKKSAPKGNFVTYDGPPYATGMPHFGHLLPSTLKDVVPRYKTMQGYHVDRRWGWDCHGLPIENLIEKRLGLKDKKAIEEYGIDKFNKAAKESVLTYTRDWKIVIERLGRWVDMEVDYRTMDSSYTESVWWSFSELNRKGLVYEGHKAMQICPRCGTPLSNFEVAQGYKDITDISAYVKFKLTSTGVKDGVYVLAWTTTPWTLPGNSALAVNPELNYVMVKADIASNTEYYILAESLLAKLKEKKVIPEDAVQVDFNSGIDSLNGTTVSGLNLVGLTYAPLFDFYSKPGSLGDQEDKRHNVWKVFAAEFVTAEDGTGVVHIAPQYGEDDLVFGRTHNIPQIQHVGEDGLMKENTGLFAGMVAKPIDDPQKTDIEMIKYLAGTGALLAKEKFIHSYPHCWRCQTPLLNYAKPSLFVRMTSLKDELIKENKTVVWSPKEIGEGRFGEWLENVRDWAISRTRFWGAPVPLWRSEKTGKTEVLGSYAELKEKIRQNSNNNKFLIMRHGQSESNVKNVINAHELNVYPLTELGKKQSAEAVVEIKKLIDEMSGGANAADTANAASTKDLIIYSSDFLRTKETAEIVAKELGLDPSQIIYDSRIRECDAGIYEGKSWGEWERNYAKPEDSIFMKPEGGESAFDVKKRMAEFLYDIESSHKNKTILIVSHGLPMRTAFEVAAGRTAREMVRYGWQRESDPNAAVRALDFVAWPHNEDYELDIHRPFIDQVTWTNEDGDEMKRIPDVFDVWYDSGAMPIASVHYPFDNKDIFDEGKSRYVPADFIAEGLDQTRGWFYSLLCLGVGLFGKTPYKAVSVNGLILAEDGKKMSKSLNNYPDLMEVIEKYGSDALRYFFLASPAVRAEDYSFSEKGVDEVNKKLFNRLENIYSFYAMYADKEREVEFGVLSFDVIEKNKLDTNILDKWILARLKEVALGIEKEMETYSIDRAVRPLMQFTDDFSTWYLRRSRDRFKLDADNAGSAEDKLRAELVTKFVLKYFAKITAPFIPFMAEEIYLRLLEVGDPTSVHLCDWPTTPALNEAEKMLLIDMSKARDIVESGLALRAKAGIKVRQPLSSLKYKASHELGVDLEQIIADELNVKKVVWNNEEELSLDTNITPELKEEGEVRELIRSIQDQRKASDLNPSDYISITFNQNACGPEMQTLIEKYKPTILKGTMSKEIIFGEIGNAKDGAALFSIKCLTESTKQTPIS